MSVGPVQAPLNFTLALQGPSVDQLASQLQVADILKRALADLLPGIRKRRTFSHVICCSSLPAQILLLSYLLSH